MDPYYLLKIKSNPKLKSDDPYKLILFKYQRIPYELGERGFNNISILSQSPFTMFLCIQTRERCFQFLSVSKFAGDGNYQHLSSLVMAVGVWVIPDNLPFAYCEMHSATRNNNNSDGFIHNSLSSCLQI